MNNFILKLQAALDRAKSLVNIRNDIRIIAAKLPKIKIIGTLNSTKTRTELNAKIKNIRPKVKVDADTTQATKKIKKLGQQNENPKVTPTVDNTQLTSGLKESQKQTKTFFDRIIKDGINANLIRISVQKVLSAIHEAISSVKELDTVKTNIQMVSRTSDSEVNAMMSSYNSMAKDLSTTTKSVSEAANEFLRMGESVSNTNELIKSAQVLSKVGMIESSDAASYLISSMKGYQIAAEDSMNIVSKLSSVDAEAAVSAGGLAEALSKCSNIARNSGVTMDRLIGYTASVGEITQKSMSEVGNSFLSLLSRMNNIKIGRFVDDETGESLSDTETVLNKLGIKLRETEDTYRDFDDVLDDIGNRWKEFSQLEQNAISVAIAGTRQRENFVALMNNYSSALEYAGVAANSAGSALERYEAYQNSVEAKTNELTAAIESLSMHTLSEEMFSGIIEATTNLVEFIDRTNVLKGTLAGLAAMGISKMFVSMATGFISASRSAAQLTSVMAMFNNGRSVANLKLIGEACVGLSNSQLKLVLSAKGLENEERQLILTGMGVTESEQQQTLATLGFAGAEDKATASTFSFSGALNALKTAVMSNPIGAAAVALTTVVTAISMYKQHLESTKQKIEDTVNSHKQAMETLASHKKTVEELSGAYNRLSRDVDTDTNQNLSLSEEDYQSYLSTINELADIFPSLRTGLDENGNAILSLGKNGRSASEDLRELLSAEEDLNNYKISQDISLLFTNVKEASDEAVQAAARYEEAASSMGAAKESLTNLSENGIDLSDAVKFSGSTSDEAGIAYYNAIVKSIQNFKNRLSDDRQIELSDVLDLSKITDTDGNGAFDIYLNTFRLSEEEKSQLQNEIKAQAKEMLPDVDNALEEAFQEQQMAKQSADLAWKDFVPDMVAAMKASGSFKGLADGEFGEDLQNFAVDLVSGLDQSISQEMGEMAPDDWVDENIVKPLCALDEAGRKEIIDAYDRLMKLNPDDLAQSNQENIDTLVGMIAERLGRTEAEIRLNLGFEVDEDLQAKYDTAVESAVSKFGSSEEEIQSLFTELEIDTSAEIDHWNTVAMCADNAAEAKKRYLETSAEPSAPPTFSTESFSKSVESLSELQNLYNDFYNDVNKDKVDFTFEFGDIEKLREDFGGVCQSFDEFEKLATSSSTTAEQMQDAFDRLATEFIVSGGMIDGLNSSTRDMIVSQMELQGIANASSIITEEVARVTGLAAEQNLTLANAADEAFLSILGEGTKAEEAKMSIYALATAEIAYNSTGLDTSGKIAQLQALATAYGDTASAALAASAASYAESMSAFHGGSYEDALKTKYESLLGMMGKFSGVSVKVGQSAANAAKSADKGSKSKEKEVDVMAELIKEMGVYQDKLKAVQDARETYDEYGKISVDQAKDIVDADFKLLAAYGSEEDALEDLGRAKLNEMQIQLARNAIDTISRITSEAEATQYLAGANEHLVGSSLDATEAMLQQAVAAAKLRGELQGQAADTILKGYQNGAMMLGQVDFKFDPSEAEKAKKDAEKDSEKQFEKQYNWVERLLDKLSRITDKWKSTVDQFTSWWNKNWSLDKAIRSNRNEIEANVDAYNYYNKKAKEIGLSPKYRDLVDNGKIEIEDIHDEELADKIDQYIEWKEKMRDCIDTIEELYDAERDMIRQKFDNMVEYYDTVDTKVQSIVNKINSLFDLNEARGKRTDINDLLEKFNGYSDITGTTTTATTESSGMDIKQHLLSDEEVAQINKEIEHQTRSIYDTATYKKLLSDIEKLEAEKEKKGARFSKSKEKKLQDYYKKQKALEENATSDTVTSYAKIYDAYLKLQNRLDDGKSLTKAQRIKYNDYVKQLEEYASERSKAVADLQKRLEDNLETSSVEAIEKAYDDQKKELEDSYKRQMEDVRGDVQGTQQYKNLIAQKDNLEKSIADLTAKKEAGTIKKSESKKLEKYLAQLDALKKKIAAIDEGATSENITDYIRAYDRLVKLQSKKKLTAKESAEYDNLMAQLKAWNQTKQDILESLNRQLLDAVKELDTAQSESVNETTADIAKSQEEAYAIAKQIAELQVSTLEDELTLIDSALSKIEKRLDLYKKFGSNRLKELGYLDADDTGTQDDLYSSAFESLIKQQSEKRSNLLRQKDIYEKLINAVASHDYDQIAQMYKNGVFEQYGDTFKKVVEMLNDNTFDGFSATWVDEWAQSSDKVTSDIYDLDMTLQDLKDRFREEVTFRAIDDAIEKLGYLKEVVKDASELINDELLYDADGSFSSFGTAKVSTLVEQLELAQQTAYEYAKKMAVIQEDTTYASDKDKETALRELKKSYDQQLLEAKGYSDSIVSLYKNQAKQEVDLLKDLIARRKEALQAKKDYYDYDRSIRSKNRDLEAIQAQIDALTGIDSAEARARKAQLEADKTDLENELDEMKKEHEYTLQIHALDNFSDQLSDALENVARDAVEILNEQRGIIDSAVKLYQQSNDMIQATIDALVKFYGENGDVPGSTAGITPITGKPANVSTSSIEERYGEGIRELKPGESLGMSEETYEKFKSLIPFNVCDNQSHVMYDNMQNLMYENNEIVRNAINAMQNRDTAPVVIHNHYDCLLKVEGNIDDRNAKLLPSQLEQSFKYNCARMDSGMRKLGWQRTYR